MVTNNIFGPGNTTGRSFRDVLHSTSGTQADNLPDIAEIQLFRLKLSLSSKDQWENWYTMMKSTLVIHNLHNVIDWTKPEPKPTAANAQRWYNASLEVKSWLLNCVDWELIREVEARGKPIDFAHEFMRELSAMITGEGNVAMQNAFIAVRRCRRNDYTTVTKYLTEMRYRLRTAMDLGVQVTPWMVWVMIFDELSKIPLLNDILVCYRKDMNERANSSGLTLMQLSEYITKLKVVIVNQGLDEATVIDSVQTVNSGKRKLLDDTE
ncbi:hypothetical protein N7452_010157 [Penicillium brevicompactum]|uniref:Uncharacterized protein n=1 Tax=Penicillium brevicompactum TaxID=5074 RepID=A0A9W9QEQ1_PENBR|nr:hypothetical protein N7452_010157 [Penicillium brevicompactum]